MKSHFEKLVKNFELKKVRGTPKGHQLTPLGSIASSSREKKKDVEQ